jgi:hypothetical protein
MTSSVEQLRPAAEQLCGSAIASFTVAGGGGNNRVYRIEAGDEIYALKVYPHSTTDTRDRLTAESAGLAFVSRHLPDRVPVPIAVDRVHGIALYTWIAGEPVGERDLDDVREAAAFIRALHEARNDPAARTLGLASEAIVGNAGIMEQIDARLARLRGVAPSDPALAALLHDRFEPELHARRQVDPAFDRLTMANRTLSPSDFGFHNALRRHGSLVFIDFEYFGWDDPVKLVSDFIWHPAMDLDDEERAIWLDEAAETFGGDPHYAARLRAYSPLIALRWVQIILNEFIPAVWERRVFAGQTDAWDDVKSRQLAKAVGILDQLAAAER